jgi:hypothetical protein
MCIVKRGFWPIVILAIVAAVTTAKAFELANIPPRKPVPSTTLSVPAPDRQGGDTIADAVAIPVIPFTDTGTTWGYGDDYDEVCPYAGSTSPDVVYRYTPPFEMVVDIDLCGSSYDTKVYVYGADQSLVVCNDDYYAPGDPCGAYVSRLENVLLQAGVTYAIVVDGYGGASGD